MYENALKKIINIYSELETKLLDEIVKHFNINEEFINSDYWRLEKLQELGLLNQNITKYIAEATKRTPEEIVQALEKIGKDTLNINNLNDAYKGGYLKIDPSTLVQKQIVQNLIEHSYYHITDRFLEISNKIEGATRKTYLDIVEKAYLQTSTGITYQNAIRQALLELGDKGITTLTYKTVDDEGNIVGIRNYDVEGTVRRELITATHNLTNEINKTVAEELDVEYLYLSEHVRCRPQHFPWQGTIIKREDLEKVTKLGQVDGMGGPNCKHYPTPYFGTARGKELKKISEEEATEQYELSQQQRYLERGVRKWKRKERIFKTADDKEYYQKCKDKVKEWQLRNKEFTENHNLRRDFTRENVERVTKVKNDGIIQKNNKILSLNECKGLIEKQNIKFWDNDLKQIDNKLLSENTQRLNELIEKYPTIQEYIKNKNVKFNALNLSNNTVAHVATDIDIKNIEISLSKSKYKDYNDFIKMEDNELAIKHCMDRSDKYKSTYTITHEFGHLIESSFIDEYNKNHLAEFHNMRTKALNAKTTTQSKNIIKNWESKITDNIAQEIYEIAKSNNSSFDLNKNLSQYGKENSFEFFAECFANAECGKPNELGKAMQQYLKKRGL